MKNMIMLVVVIASLFLIAYIYNDSSNKVNDMMEKVLERDEWELVLDKETGVNLFATKEYITPEIKKVVFLKVVRTFFEKMYGFDADTYESNMTDALMIGPDVGKIQFLKYEKEGMFHKLVNDRIRFVATMDLDSINITENSLEGMKGFIRGFQKIIKPSASGTYEYIFEFEIKAKEITKKNISGAEIVLFERKYKKAINTEIYD